MARIRPRHTAGLALAAGLTVAPLAARAQNFSAPVQLDPDTNRAVVAMDASGTALAAWPKGIGASYSVHAPGTAWTTPLNVNVGDPDAAYLSLHVSAGGSATLMTFEQDEDVIWATVRPAGGSFSPPYAVARRTNVNTPIGSWERAIMLIGNPSGAEAIVWNGPGGINVSRRTAGGPFGATELIPPPAGEGIGFADATMDEAGDVLVAWEAISFQCPPPTNFCQFVVHASREQAGTSGWTDSGPLTNGLGPDAWVVRAAIDTTGRGALALQPGPNATSLKATRQAAGGGAWSKPAITVFADTTGGNPELWGASGGPPGQVSFLALDAGPSASVLFGDGNLNSNAVTIANLSAADPSPPSVDTGAFSWDLQAAPLAFASNPANGAVVAWVDTDNTMRAALRPSGSNLFATQTLVPGDSCQVTQPLGDVTPCKWATSAAINAQGDAAVLYIDTSGASGGFYPLKLFATTTN